VKPIARGDSIIFVVNSSMGVERGPCRAADRKLSFALHADAMRRWCLLQKAAGERRHNGTSWCHVIVLGIFFSLSPRLLLLPSG
jgi:hypothetical protein